MSSDHRTIHGSEQEPAKVKRKRIGWLQAREVTVYCKLNKIRYANESQYPNTFKAGLKRNLRSTCGMLYHLPREEVTRFRKEEDNRVYICWFGEPLDQVIETAAFLKMTTKRELWLLRCKTAGDGSGKAIYESVVEDDHDDATDR